MPRLLTAITALTLLLSGTAHAVSLKENSTLTTGVIQIQDIFHGVQDHAPQHAQHILGNAPHPGDSITLNARTLQRIALAADLPWKPTSHTTSITLTRAATILTKQAITTQLTRALASTLNTPHFNLTLSPNTPTLTLPSTLPATFTITQLNYTPETHNFTATIAAPNAETPYTQATLSGTATPMIAIPTLNTTVRNGDIINANDIQLHYVSNTSILPSFLLTKDDLIGMTPRRTLTAGTPIKENDLEHPRLISRGDTVTVIYTQGPLRLTSSAKAMQHGAHGDLIRLHNPSSNRRIDGHVSGDNEVTLTLF